MRNTRDFLHKTAKDHVNKRVKSERDLMAAYMIGSVLSDDPLLGGTTDIDIVLIHAGEPKIRREIIRVNDEIHLDVVHHSQSDYSQPRELRMNAWMGTAIQNHPALLYDVRHWFEFTQASVGAQFYRADHVIARARGQLEKARTIWADLHEGRPTFVKKVRKYQEAVECAGNAIACINGSPLPRRRFLWEFPASCEEIGSSGLSTGLINLLCIQTLTSEHIINYLPEWEKAFHAAGEQTETSPDLHPLRLDYYKQGIKAYIEERDAQAAAYPLFYTWSKAVSFLYATSPEYIAWYDVIKELGLGKEKLPEKFEALDTFLDHVEEVLEDWATKEGA